MLIFDWTINNFRREDGWEKRPVTQSEVDLSSAVFVSVTSLFPYLRQRRYGKLCPRRTFRRSEWEVCRLNDNPSYYSMVLFITRTEGEHSYPPIPWITTVVLLQNCD